ncbi:MAG: TIGR01459 family HAD-type hydrolase [Ancalomicrobiaceae bacterium]|nr:TIGR01459 family HAD-type hydrolase [Ancalomicrobiaceae bacterium]
MSELIPGLSTLARDYRGILSDIWGVVHNGVAAFPAAVEALVNYRATGGRVVLITNAPRPNAPIHEQLKKFGISGDAYDEIVTSGDVTREWLADGPHRSIAYIGPERDRVLIAGLDIAEVSEPAEADALVVTGLTDDETEGPEDYRARLAEFARLNVPLICANPDIVVERGHRLVWCAGSLARLYVELGGKVDLLGKPHNPIYAQARARLDALAGRPLATSEVLAIGDGLPTDGRGAIAEGLDLLFITAGIHAADFGDADAPDIAKVRARLTAEGLSARAVLARLKW